MAKLYNLARMSTATSGTGTITLASAVSGYLTFALAGISNAEVVSYGIKDGANSEVGTGTYTSAGTTLTRTVTKSTNSNTAISLSGTAEVFITARAEDIVAAPADGKLTFVSTTAIKFAPYGGSQIRINGSIYAIPSAGIAGVANTSVFVNGTGASNLAATTAYLVCAFINSGVVTADFLTTLTHAQSTTAGNEGTEIKNGDDTRTVIGMIRTNGSSQFADSASQRFVRSWFNESGVSTTNAFTAARSTASATLVEVNTEIRNEFLVWSGESANFIASGTAQNSTSGSSAICGISFDGNAPASISQMQSSTGASQPFGVSPIAFNVALSEGYHYATLFGTVGNTTGTATWNITQSTISGVYTVAGRIGR